MLNDAVERLCIMHIHTDTRMFSKAIVTSQPLCKTKVFPNQKQNYGYPIWGLEIQVSCPPVFWRQFVRQPNS